VLMLNRVMEKGQPKCAQYWPQEVGGRMEMADVGLALETSDSQPGQHYTVRTLKLIKLGEENGEESREILHFQ